MIDLDRARADTPGSNTRIHLDNARASLMPAPVLAAVQEHLQLEAELGSAEAAEVRMDAIAGAYDAAAALVNAAPAEVTIYTGGTLDVLSRSDEYVLDLSGAIGRVPVDVRIVDRAAVIAGGGAYLRAPAGTGLLVLRGGRRAQMTVSTASLLGLGAAIEYASGWGVDAIEQRIDELTVTLQERLAALKGVSAQTADGAVAFEVAFRDPRDVAWALRKRGITVGLNGTRVLVSPHYFNTEQELDQLVSAVELL